MQVARAHPHLTGGGFDLPPVGCASTPATSSPIPLPRADVLIMGHVLHNWSLDRRKTLLVKAHEALPEGGRLWCTIRSSTTSAGTTDRPAGEPNMLIETEGGSDYTAAECRAWMREAGFRDASLNLSSGRTRWSSPPSECVSTVGTPAAGGSTPSSGMAVWSEIVTYTLPDPKNAESQYGAWICNFQSYGSRDHIDWGYVYSYCALTVFRLLGSWGRSVDIPNHR